MASALFLYELDKSTPVWYTECMKTKQQIAALRKAFDEEQINMGVLAKNLRTSRGRLYNIKYGSSEPGALLTLKIEKATEGKIPRELLRPNIFI